MLDRNENMRLHAVRASTDIVGVPLTQHPWMRLGQHRKAFPDRARVLVRIPLRRLMASVFHRPPGQTGSELRRGLFMHIQDVRAQSHAVSTTDLRLKADSCGALVAIRCYQDPR